MRRHLRVAGTPYQIGLALGREAGEGLAERIDRYIAEDPDRFATVARGRLDQGTMPWFDRLPARFREKVAGLADGSGVPLRRVAERTYVEACNGYGTVYSNIVCPSSGEIHFTFGGLPAASRSIWTPVERPWA